MLTLYTTPVIYLYMDRLRLRALGKHRDTFSVKPEGAV
jgi:multidrug efflux pump